VHLSGFSRVSARDGGLRPSKRWARAKAAIRESLVQREAEGLQPLAATTRASRGQTPKRRIMGWSEKDSTSAVCAVMKRETCDSRIV